MGETSNSNNSWSRIYLNSNGLCFSPCGPINTTASSTPMSFNYVFNPTRFTWWVSRNIQFIFFFYDETIMLIQIEDVCLFFFEKCLWWLIFFFIVIAKRILLSLMIDYYVCRSIVWLRVEVVLNVVVFFSLKFRIQVGELKILDRYIFFNVTELVVCVIYIETRRELP